MALITRFENGSIDNCEDLALAIELVLRDSFRHVGEVKRDKHDCAVKFETENEGFLITVSIDPAGYFDATGPADQHPHLTPPSTISGECTHGNH